MILYVRTVQACYADLRISLRELGGHIQMTSTHDAADDRAAKEGAQAVFATFLDFHILEVWLLDKRIETLRRGVDARSLNP